MLASVVRTVKDGRRVVVVVAAADDDTEKEDDTEVNICGKEW
jgi:D-alanyl-D-alanine carboxypeptidase